MNKPLLKSRAGGGNRWTPERPDRRCFKTRRLLRAGFAGFASGCRSENLERVCLLSPGGWRASCPATYRPTHVHRHVRIWARRHIVFLAVDASEMFRERQIILNFFGAGESSPPRSALHESVRDASGLQSGRRRLRPLVPQKISKNAALRERVTR